MTGQEVPNHEGLGNAEALEDDAIIGSKNVHGNERGPKKGKQKQRHDHQLLVSCATVEALMFGDHFDPSKTSGRKKDRASRGTADAEAWTSIDMEDSRPTTSSAHDPVGKEIIDGDILARMSIRSGTRIRPSQDVSEVNGGVGGEKGRAERVEESEEMLERRMEGQKKANQREMVRCAARRGVVFGFVLNNSDNDNGHEQRRKCEAVMQDKVVEPSFAKGDWSIRWREDGA